MSSTRRYISLLPLLFISFFIASTLICTLSSSFQTPIVTADIDYETVIPNVNMTAIKEHVEYLSSLGTRETGSAGNQKAAEYIRQILEGYGLEGVTTQNVTVTNVVDHGANISLLGGEVFTLYPMEPNLVAPSTTPPGGITGELVYCGDGWLSDLDGKAVNGSIAILNWNTGNQWITLASLGAKAIIFLPVEEYDEANFNPSPFTATAPVNMPRFYVSREDGRVLVEHAGETAHLVANSCWEEVTSQNVIGMVNGTKYDQNIVLSAYYDTHTSFPSAAPGAEEALGIATLLEIAKYTKDNPPDYNIIFVALTAHNQWLMGANQFYEDYVFKPALEYVKGLGEDGANWRYYADSVRLWMHLQLYSGSKVLYLTNLGEYVDIVDPLPKTGTLAWYPGLQPIRYLEQVFNEINQQSPFDKTYNAVIDNNSSNPIKFTDYADVHAITPMMAYDSDRAAASFTPSLTFTTAYDIMPTLNMPWDTAEHVNWNNLEPQVQLVYCMLYNIFRIDNSVLYKNSAKTGWWDDPYFNHNDYHFYKTYVGTVVEWDPMANDYTPVPNALVVLSQIYSHTVGDSGDQGFANPTMRIYNTFTFADETGHFEFRSNRYVDWEHQDKLLYSAWIIDNDTGNVLYAPDQGTYAWPRLKQGTSLPNSTTGFSTVSPNKIVVFNCSTAVFYNLFDPLTLTGGFWRQYMGGTGEIWMQLEHYSMPLGVTIDLQVLEFSAHYPVEHFSFVWTGGPDLTTAFVAFPSETPVEFKIMAPAREIRYPLAIINNASDENPNGVGYTLQPGEQIEITTIPLLCAKDLYLLNDERVDTLLRVNPQEKDAAAVAIHANLSLLLTEAEEALANHQYSKYFQLSVDAWNDASKVYKYIRSLLEDSATTVPYFAILLVPFVILAERLLFNTSSIKKIFPYLAIGGVILCGLYLFHPGFSVAANPTTIVIGVSLLILSIPLFLIMLSHTSALIRDLSIKAHGKHFEDLSKGSLFLTGLFMGIDNMKKRKLRTALTLITMIIMLVGFINIVSISPITTIQTKNMDDSIVTVDYNGVYIHQLAWESGVPEVGVNMLNYLEYRYGTEATIIPRVWVYDLESVGGFSFQIYDSKTRAAGFRAVFGEKTIAAWSLFGLSDKEPEATGLDVWLVAGRWFVETDVYAIILTENQAAALNIAADDLPVQVSLGDGMGNFSVVGIISADYSQIKDLDEEEITPLDLHTREGGELVPEFDRHEYVEDVFIVPVRFATKLNYYKITAIHYYTASVTLIFEEQNQVGDAAEDIFQRFSGHLIYSKVEGDPPVLRSTGFAIQTLGLEFQAIPIALVALSILNLMVASVYERRREIFTYGNLGMSPTHIGSMFLSESLVYGLFGALIGYLVAIVTSRILWLYDPTSVNLNYSSSWVANTLTISVGVIVLSSIYPTILAARLSTPSLKRAWEITVKPSGNMWEIPFPFFTNTDEETRGLLSYLFEYFIPHSSPRSPDFSVAKTQISEQEIEGKPMKTISMTTNLFPYEAGVSQKTMISAVKIEGKWEYRIVLERITGLTDDWQRLNRPFIGGIRRQFLMWRSLPNAEKARYIGLYKAE